MATKCFLLLQSSCGSHLGYHELFRGRLYDDRLPGLVWHRIRFHGVTVISMMVVIIMVNGVPVVVLLKQIYSFFITYFFCRLTVKACMVTLQLY